MEAPVVPVLNDPTSLSLQLTDSHLGLGLGTRKVQDLHAFAVSQLVLIIHEVEVATHDRAPNPNICWEPAKGSRWDRRSLEPKLPSRPAHGTLPCPISWLRFARTVVR